MNGLMLGMMYALVAVGFTLFFGVLDIIKFSHGDVLTVGAFTALATYVGLRSAGVGSSPVILLIMLVVAIFAMAALGMLIARALVLPLRSAPALNTLLITLMLGTVLRESVRLFYPQGANPKAVPGAAAVRVGQFRQFQPAARQRPDARRPACWSSSGCNCCSTGPSWAWRSVRWRRTRKPRAPWASTSPPSC
jgi:branched-subunit amino acid ABC-type transport system permease component